MQEVVLGILSSMLSPFMMVVGFIIWEDSWKGSAYALNFYKCSVAGLIFLLMSYSIRALPTAEFLPLAMLTLSSLLGIVIGDNTWLLALQMIGAKHVILIDTLKPFLGAILGNIYLGEPLTFKLFVGIVITSSGILLVSMERADDKEKVTVGGNSSKEGGDEDSVVYARVDDNESDFGLNESEDPSQQSQSPPQAYAKKTALTYSIGYSLALVNVVLDAFGSLLTKKFGVSFNTLEINFVRFGFAAVFMLCFSGIMHSQRFICSSSNCSSSSSGSSGFSDGIEITTVTGEFGTEKLDGGDASAAFEYPETSKKDTEGSLNPMRLDGHFEIETRQVIKRDQLEDTPKNQESVPPLLWYQALPPAGTMHRRQWLLVTCGILFVTVTCPALSNWALMVRQLPLSLVLTLTSLGPVYMLPLLWAMRGERFSYQSSAGVVLAFGGVAVLCYS